MSNLEMADKPSVLSITMSMHTCPLLPDIWEQVFNYLESSDQNSAACVSQLFSEIAGTILWTEPIFRKQIEPYQLAKLANIQHICRLHLSNIKLQVSIEAANELSNILQTIINIQGKPYNRLTSKRWINYCTINRHAASTIPSGLSHQGDICGALQVRRQ